MVVKDIIDHPPTLKKVFIMLKTFCDGSQSKLLISITMSNYFKAVLVFPHFP